MSVRAFACAARRSGTLRAARFCATAVHVRPIFCATAASVPVLHHTRDVTLGEDRCRVRRGRAPRVLASLRNVAVCLLRRANHPSAATAVRATGAKPELALAWLNDPDSISA